MEFGLQEKIIYKIRHVLSLFPEIEEAILFGSRAKGNFRAGSDIDLALKGDGLSLSVMNQLGTQLDDLLSPYTFELSLLSQIADSEVLDHIRRVGISFYRRQETGKREKV
ncbi:MAG: nucleotidyltransferase domain-containing protein [Saprospiraceae bacterium]